MNAQDMLVEATTLRAHLDNVTIFLNGQQADPLLAVIGAYAQAKAEAPSWRALAQSPLDGEPDLAVDFGAALERSQAAMEEASCTLQHADQDAPEALTGTTGLTMAQALKALADATGLEVEGLGIFAEALKTYGTRADAGRNYVEERRYWLVGAADEVDKIYWDEAKLTDPVTGPGEEDWIRSQVNKVVSLAEDALNAFVSGCEDICGAEEDLLRALSDAEGYLQLANVPEGMTPLDALGLQGITLAGDPDSAVLSDAEQEKYAQRWSSLSPQDKAYLTALLASLTNPLAKSLLASGFASGAPLDTLAAFAQKLATATDVTLQEVANLRMWNRKDNPDRDVTAGGVEHQYTQQTGTTCGPTSVFGAVAAQDPFVAWWLITGEKIGGWTPPYMEDLGDLNYWSTKSMTPEERMRRVEEAIQHRANWIGTGFPWFDGIGISPWGAAKELERAGSPSKLEWTSGWYAGLGGESKPPNLALDDVAAAVNKGQPALLLVGPEGSDANMPRHYLLVTGYHNNTYTIFEPNSGRTYDISRHDLLDPPPGGPPGFGGWDKLRAAIVPNPAGNAGQR